MFTVPHKLVYWVLAGIHAGSYFGLEETIVAIFVAVAYALLAVMSER